jgi:putative membrane protein
MKLSYFSAGAAAVSLLLGAAAFALDATDQKFTTNASVANLAEIQLAELAQQKASAGEVKQYAQHLRQDHQRATEKLNALAAQKGAQLPAELDAQRKREKERLAKLEGAAFDKAYIDLMVKDHKKSISEFEKQAERGNDAELKQFAAQALPKLREHLNQAQQLQSQLKQSEKRS